MAKAYKCDNCGSLNEGTSEEISEIVVGDFLIGIVINQKTAPPPEDENPTPGMRFGPFEWPAPEKTDRRDIQLCRPCADEVLRSLGVKIHSGDYWEEAAARKAALESA